MGTEVIRKRCKVLGISVNNVLILGRGSSRHKDGRYQLSVSRNKQKKSGLKFAVQYCKDLKVFIAWELQRPAVPIREKYTVKAVDIENNLRNKIERVGKYIEYSGWNEENVLVFNLNLVDEFLIEYVKE